MMDLQSVVYEIGERNPLQRKNILTAMHVLTQEEISEANRELSFFKEKMGYTRDEIVAAYLWFIDTFMSAQIDFSRTGRYQHSTFAEIEHYYKDEQLMRDYVASLAVTLYLFPQHIETMRFYKSSIAPPPPPPPQTYDSKERTFCRRYLEIGPGHGHLLVTAMENSNYDQYIAVDISQAAVDTSTAYVRYCLPERKDFKIQHKNFFDFESSEKFHALVMGEVLEHVEDPEKFLRKIHQLAADDAFIFITTAVNAPCFDHIYHFHTVEEVEAMFARCGLYVKDKVYGIANGVTLEKAIKKKYSIVPAYVLGKAK